MKCTGKRGNEETYRGMEGNMQGIATKGISEPLNHRSSNRFIYSRNNPRVSIKYACMITLFCKNILYKNTEAQITQKLRTI